MSKLDEAIGHYDLQADTFSRKSKVHDWRNHVGTKMQEVWSELSLHDRLLVAMTADEAAEREEWD